MRHLRYARRVPRTAGQVEDISRGGTGGSSARVRATRADEPPVPPGEARAAGGQYHPRPLRFVPMQRLPPEVVPRVRELGTLARVQLRGPRHPADAVEVSPPRRPGVVAPPRRAGETHPGLVV